MMGLPGWSAAGAARGRLVPPLSSKMLPVRSVTPRKSPGSLPTMSVTEDGTRTQMLQGPRTTDADDRVLPGAADEAPQPVWAPPSWEQIVVEHSPRVYRLAYRLTGNRAD